jgi:hypothetical protein
MSWGGAVPLRWLDEHHGLTASIQGVHPMTGLRPFALALALLGLFGLALPANTCPFCTQELGRTMVEDYSKASLVIYGTFTNARLKDGGGFAGEGETDFVIEQVIKSDPAIKGLKKVTIPQYRNHPKIKFVLFCDVYKGRIDPYRADVVADGSELVEYFTGAVKVKDRPLPERLAYCFPYLNSKEFEVSLDAYREFGAADYKEYRDMAKKLDPQVLIGWLDDPKTPPYRFGLYASLLGHCGKGKEQADFLRRLIENTDRHKGSGLDGMMVGMIMILPKEGWRYVEHDVILNTKSDFQTRYAALRAMRFLWAQRPDLVEKAALVNGMIEAAEFSDIADFAIEDLRKWQRWEMTDQVLKLAGRKSHDVGVIQRAALRFALQSPAKAAADYVTQARKRDPEQVRDTEEILKLEPDAPSPVPNAK